MVHANDAEPDKEQGPGTTHVVWVQISAEMEDVGVVWGHWGEPGEGTGCPCQHCRQL